MLLYLSELWMEFKVSITGYSTLKDMPLTKADIAIHDNDPEQLIAASMQLLKFIEVKPYLFKPLEVISEHLQRMGELRPVGSENRSLCFQGAVQIAQGFLSTSNQNYQNKATATIFNVYDNLGRTSQKTDALLAVALLVSSDNNRTQKATKLLLAEIDKASSASDKLAHYARVLEETPKGTTLETGLLEGIRKVGPDPSIAPSIRFNAYNVAFSDLDTNNTFKNTFALCIIDIFELEDSYRIPVEHTTPTLTRINFYQELFTDHKNAYYQEAAKVVDGFVTTVRAVSEPIDEKVSRLTQALANSMPNSLLRRTLVHTINEHVHELSDYIQRIAVLNILRKYDRSNGIKYTRGLLEIESTLKPPGRKAVRKFLSAKTPQVSSPFTAQPNLAATPRPT